MSQRNGKSRKTADETWIGVVSLLPDGEQFALAWVRRRDEWLADAAAAYRGNEIEALGRMYLEAIEKRGHPPTKLNVRAAAHAEALRDVIGPGIPIKVGFDNRAEALSDAAAEAVDIAFNAEQQVDAAASAPGDVSDDEDLRLLPLVEVQYDPDTAPDPAAWLAMDEGERQQHIRLAHLAADEPLRGQRLQLHAGMHDAIETQLASNEPPQTADALARLQSDGLTRHDALHAIANVLVKSMHDVLTTNEPFDIDKYAANLAELTSAD